MTESSAEVERRFPSRNFLIIVVSWMIWSPVHNMIWTYEPLYIKALGASSTILGLIYAVSGAVLAFSRLPGGYIADRFGRRKLIIVMSHLYAASYFLYALAPDWRLILVAAVLGNVFLVYEPALSAIVADSVPPEVRGLSYGLSTFLPGVVSLVAPLVSGYMVSAYGLVGGMRIIYALGAGLALLACFLRFLFLQETHRGVVERRPLIADFFSGYREAFVFLGERIPFIVFLFVFAAFAEGAQAFVSPYAVEYLGIPENLWYQVYMAFSVANLVLTAILSYFIDRVGRRNVGLVSSLIFIFSMPAYVLITPRCRNVMQYAALVLSLVMASYHALWNVASTLIADFVPRERRGRIITLVFSIHSLSLSASRFLCGVLYDAVSPGSPFLFASVSMVFAFMVIVFWLREPERREF